jgi:hypothetical protein
MNYERTVKDFGRCESGGKNSYNFQLISNCVRGPFDVKCKDSRFPVVCGDHTCRRTFPECLQVLHNRERQAATRKLVPSGAETPLFGNGDDTDGSWAFGDNGIDRPDVTESIDLIPKQKPHS